MNGNRKSRDLARRTTIALLARFHRCSSLRYLETVLDTVGWLMTICIIIRPASVVVSMFR
jgi:hypothetical protein